MKILVTGSRNWKKVAPILREIKKLPPNSILVHGAARGADSIADLVAKNLGLERKAYPAEWEKYKKSAGPIRNRLMLEKNPDIELILAFHEHIEDSKGTADMIKVAEKAGILVKLFKE